MGKRKTFTTKYSKCQLKYTVHHHKKNIKTGARNAHITYTRAVCGLTRIELSLGPIQATICLLEQKIKFQIDHAPLSTSHTKLKIFKSNYCELKTLTSRSLWPRGLRRRSAAACLLG